MAPIKILFVCLGNICRSPMAEGIFKAKVMQKGLSAHLKEDSAGTSAYHLGELPDERMRATAQQHDILLTHRARQFEAADFGAFDYILVMDENNRENVLALAAQEGIDPSGQVFMMRAFDQTKSGTKVDDPYFGGQDGFESVYQVLAESCENFIDYLQAQHPELKTASR